MENARRDGFRPGLLLTGAEDEDEALEVVAAEEHRLSARALTAINVRLMIDDIMGELSVWAGVWAGVFLCLGPIELGTSQITSHVDFSSWR